MPEGINGVLINHGAVRGIHAAWYIIDLCHNMSSFDRRKGFLGCAWISGRPSCDGGNAFEV